VEQIAQSTLIAPDYLRAIEAEEFAKLPSGVYATSYIRQYARAIGYSETALLDQYHARTEEETVPIDAGQRAPRLNTRLGEALGEAMELFRWRSPAKPRAQHPA
jgi:cytoskeletal protein RodZ